MALRLYQAARLLAVTAPDRETIPVGAFLANDGLIMVFQTAVARVGGPCRGAFGELAAAECGLRDRVRRQGPGLAPGARSRLGMAAPVLLHSVLPACTVTHDLPDC